MSTSTSKFILEIKFLSNVYLTGAGSWDKTCCNSESGHPVIPPPSNLTDQDIKKVCLIHDAFLGNLSQH